MSKGFVLGFVFGLSLGVGAHRPQKERTRNSEAERYLSEVSDATPVRLGTLTANQRVHSRLNSRYSELTRHLPGDKTISETIAHSKSKFIERSVEIGLVELLNEPELPETYFHELAQKSDLIIRGRVSAKASQVTEDDAFLFTDYEVTVAEVFKNNATTPVDVGQTIVVTRPGGKIVVDGVILKAIDRAYDLLPIGTNEVVAFLQFISETGAYKTTGPTGSFELDGSIVQPLTAAPFPPGVIRDRDSFLIAIRTVSNR